MIILLIDSYMFLQITTKRIIACFSILFRWILWAPKNDISLIQSVGSIRP